MSYEQALATILAGIGVAAAVLVPLLWLARRARLREQYCDQLSHTDWKRFALAHAGESAEAFDRAERRARDAWVEAHWGR